MIRRLVPPLCCLGILLAASLSLAGCHRDSGRSGSLKIATSWPEPERAAIAKAFERWLISQTPKVPKVKLDWLVLERGTDPAQVLRSSRGGWDLRPGSPQVVLGGPISNYRTLAKAHRLVPAHETDPLPWRVVRRSPFGWAIPSKPGDNPKTKNAEAPPARPVPRPTFDDPRFDPVALAWAKHELGSGSWDDGYARLIRDAAHPRRIGRQAGSALAAVERGEAEATPIPATDLSGRPSPAVFILNPDAPEWVEGAGIVAERGRPVPPLARLFFQFLDETGQAEEAQSKDEVTEGDETTDPDVDSLLADLLGATLVDAQDELWTAWAALNRAERPPKAAAIWLTQAPPWPPASIEKLEREGSDSEALIQTLVGQLVPDAQLRAWLSRSWLGPKRLVDGALLMEIAQAADGRLAREPRFRAWLRAEWTAWARQRYRRVTRTVKGLTP